MNGIWHDKTVAQLEEAFQTDIRTGLTRKEAAKRLRRGGENSVYPVARGSATDYIKHIVTDLTSILLIITAIIAAVFEQTAAATVIIALLLLNYACAIYIYVRAHRVLESMGESALPVAHVMRDGRLYTIKSANLVQGDIIFINAGDIAPADARLIEADSLSMLEVNVTGALRSTAKDAERLIYGNVPPGAQANMIFASSIATAGVGKAVVVGTGEETLIRRTGKTTFASSHEKLRVLSTLKKYCAVWSLVMLGLIFALCAIDITLGLAGVHGLRDFSIFNSFLTGLTLACASMSELYAAFGYIIVACGCFSAANRFEEVNTGVLIKNVEKLESLKELTCLIVPKDGGFTNGAPKITRVIANNDEFAPNERGFIRNSEQTIRYGVISTGIYGAGAMITGGVRKDSLRSPEEDAIISLAQQHGMYDISLEHNYPMLEHRGVGGDSRFETTLTAFEGGFVCISRGEASLMLKKCSSISMNGRVLPLTPEKRSELQITVQSLEREAYRVIAVASKSSIYSSLSLIGYAQSELTLEGFLAMREPILPGAARNIAKCADAGIKVIMLCDEPGSYGAAFARAAGVVKSDDEIITSEQLLNMKDALFRANASSYRLYQGLNITQKRMLLKYLRESGERVGVLSCALDEIILQRESDFGFSQSLTLSSRARRSGVQLQRPGVRAGSEAVKFVSDAIVSAPEPSGSGGFNAMIESIACAKNIYLNLGRTMKYLLTSQLARFFIVLFSIITGQSLLTPVQILICGLVVDFFGVITIAFERPETDILTLRENTEQSFEKPLINNIQSILFGLFWSVAAISSSYLLTLLGMKLSSAEAGSALFAGMLITQLIALIEIKKPRSLINPNIRINRFSFALTVMIAAFITICMLLPSVGAFFGIIQLSLYGWICAVLPPVLMLIVYEISKLISA